MRRVLPGLLLLGAVALPLAASSQPVGDTPSLDNPSTFGSKSEAVETTVVIPRAAALDPALLDQIRQKATRQEREFTRTAELDFEAFGKEDFWSPYSLQIDFEERLVSDRFISLLAAVWFYTGGAHGNLGYESVNWDRTQGREIGLGDLIEDVRPGSAALQALARYIRQDLATQKAELYREIGEPPPDPDTDEWLSAVTPDPEILSTITLAPAREKGRIAGLMIHFPPYAVGPYADGPFDVLVPASVLAPFLTEDYRPLFGGEPVMLERIGTYDGSGSFLFLRTPGENARVMSPLEIAGEAPDSWFVEGTAPVRLETEDGTVATGVISAEPDKPVSESAVRTVAFSGTLSFPAPEELTDALLIFSEETLSDRQDEERAEVSLPLRLIPQ